MQLGLFDIPLARNTDPITSHDAAEHMRESGKIGEHERIVLELVKMFPDSTSRELAEHTALGRHEVARRLPGLRDKGLVTQGEPRKCRLGRGRAVVWMLVR